MAPGQCPGRKLACAGGAVCCGKEAGKDTAKPPPETCVSVLHKRGVSRRSVARRDSGGTPPRGLHPRQAGFLRSARPGGCIPGKPASCVPQGRKGPSETTGADVRYRSAQARASARRSVARIVQSGHGPRTCVDLSKSTSEASCPRRELPRAGTHRGRALTARSSASVSSPLRGANRPVRSRTAKRQPRHWACIFSNR